MSRRRRRGGEHSIAFFGLFGVGNLGNEASLRAALDSARRVAPTARLFCVCEVPDRVAAEHRIESVSIDMSGPLARVFSAPRPVRLALRPIVELFRWIESYRFARRMSAVIVPGTGILDDFGMRPRQMPYAIFRWSVASRLAGTPFAMVSVGAGPIEHPASRWLMRRAVESASYCSYRDIGSQEFMASIGVSTSRSDVLPDVVMALPRPALDADGSGDTTVIGVGIMAYFGWDNDRANGQEIFRSYIDRVSTLVRGLLERGRVVQLLVGDGADDLAVDALVAELGVERPTEHWAGRIRFAPVESMVELLVQIGRTDLVVATRYHNLVGALMMGRPVISIGYADKNADLMKDVGLGAYCHHVDTFSPDVVLDDLDQLLAQWDQLAPVVERRVADYGRQVDAQFESVIARR